MALIISSVKYLMVFSVALLFFRIAEMRFSVCNINARGSKNSFRPVFSKRRISGYLCAFTGIVILSLFAGIRAADVGADTSGYPVSFMRIAIGSKSFKTFVSNCGDLSGEPLGALLVYLCSRVTKKTGLLLFSYQFLTITPVFFAALRFSKRASITDSIGVYLFLFFNNSLNMMRQSVGCAFILYGMAIVLEQNRFRLKAMMAFIIAILFHRASIYGFLMIFAVYFTITIEKKWLKYCVYVAVICTPILLDSIVGIISNVTNDAHMLFYLDVFISGKAQRDWFVDPFSMYSVIYILVLCGSLALPNLFHSSIFGKRRYLYETNNTLSVIAKLKTMNTIGALVYMMLLLSLKTMYGMRFSLFFDFLYMLSIPISVGKSKNKRIIMYAFLFVAWFVWIMRMGWSGSSLYHMSI